MLIEVTAEPVLNGLREALVDDFETLSACPVCRGADSLFEVARLEGSSPGPASAGCAACGLIFVRRRPTEAWLSDFYRRSWDAGGRAGAARREPPQPDDRIAAFCAPHLGPRAKVLDAGAGFGGQLLAFAARGHDVEALELSQHRAVYLRDVLGIPTTSSPVEELERPGEFDLVYMNHVLEHLPDPLTALRAAAGTVRPGGLLYVAVPNLWHEYPPQTFHFVPHQATYTGSALARLAAACGCEVLELEEEAELRLLARREAPADRVTAEAEAGFEGRVREWTGQAFGEPGHRTLAWQKSRDPRRTYDVDRLGGRFSAPLVRGVRAVERRLPAILREGLRRAVPAWFFGRSLRLLPIRVVGDPSGPVVISYGRRPAPIWVK